MTLACAPQTTWFRTPEVMLDMLFNDATLDLLHPGEMTCDVLGFIIASQGQTAEHVLNLTIRAASNTEDLRPQSSLLMWQFSTLRKPDTSGTIDLMTLRMWWRWIMDPIEISIWFKRKLQLDADLHCQPLEGLRPPSALIPTFAEWWWTLRRLSRTSAGNLTHQMERTRRDCYTSQGDKHNRVKQSDAPKRLRTMLNSLSRVLFSF